MNDILPDQAAAWQFLEGEVRAVLNGAGFREIRLPLLERTELFRRSIGEATDIVEKEMYTFSDRNGDSLTLRPEGTAGAVRAGLTNGLIVNQKQRLWYGGPMFRRERPQAGRYRQFYQIGAEAFGFDGPDIDAELILLLATIWQRIGLEGLTLQINSLGTPASRAAHRAVLVDYFTAYADRLDDDSRRRLQKNPLRILDSKNPALADLVAGAPELAEYLDAESREHFEQLLAYLDAAGVDYLVNPRLVRGLDYYTRTVFEWTTDALGAQNAVCAGGRYDGLVAHLGGRDTPGIGWAMGLDRLVALMQAGGVRIPAGEPHAYLVTLGDAARQAGLVLASRLREALPSLRLTVHCGGGNFSNQMKKADQSGAAVAIIVGDDEIAAREAGFKPLRSDEPQAAVAWGALAQRLAAFVERHARDS